MTTEQAPPDGAALPDTTLVERPLPARAERPTARRELSRPTTRPARTPDLVGLALLDARQEAGDAGFRVTVTVWVTKIAPWGHVLSQEPTPGTPMPTGNTIHVVVAGRPHVTLPDLRGLDAHAADVELRRLGLMPGGHEERRSLTVPAGGVLATRPAGGSLVVDGSLVVIVVSRDARAGRPHP